MKLICTEDNNIKSNATKVNKGNTGTSATDKRPRAKARVVGRGGSVRSAGYNGGKRNKVSVQSGFSDHTGGQLPSEVRVTAGQRASAVLLSRGRGRRPMPELRQARQLMSSARSEVIARIKAVHAAELALGAARHAKDRAGSAKAAKLKAVLTKATRLLKSANNFEVQASRKLAKVIASESARTSAETRARTLARYQEKQELKAEADLQKAVAGFIAAWKKQRVKIDARKLAVVTRKATAHAAMARKQANAKARAAVEKAAAVSKAGARKAADKVRAKAARLQVQIGR